MQRQTPNQYFSYRLAICFISVHLDAAKIFHILLFAEQMCDTVRCGWAVKQKKKRTSPRFVDRARPMSKNVSIDLSKMSRISHIFSVDTGHDKLEMITGFVCFRSQIIYMPMHTHRMNVYSAHKMITIGNIPQ